jgi:ribonuclease HI
MANEASLEAILEAIRSLSPAERRRLQRRLQVSGLLEKEDKQTDVRRLDVAPAVRAVKPRRSSGDRTGRKATDVTAAPAQPSVAAHPPVAPAKPSSAVPLRMAGGRNAAGKDAAPGRVVIGSPDKNATAPDPHTMSPLPGQAPEQPIAIVFDGGSKGNPGYGYGSYALRWPGQPQQIVQLQFGNHVTNNEAEYDTLIGALEAILKRLKEGGADPKSARLDIRGDSMLVIKQVQNEWKCTEERLRVRRDRAQALLTEFGHWKLTHHDRENSVRVLGH